LSLLTTWIRLAEVHEACDVLGPGKKTGLFAISGTSVAAVRQGTENELFPYWERCDDRVCIAWRAVTLHQDVANALSSLNINDLQPLLLKEGDAESIPDSILSALNLTPSPTFLSSLLKGSSRKDVASEILSALLEAYTLAKQSGRTLSTGASTSTDSVILIQHILEIINTFGSEALAGQANKVLSFIDFALGSNVPSQQEKGPTCESSSPLLRAKGTNEGAFAGLTNIGSQLEENGSSSLPKEEEDDEVPDEELVETALNLLLSLLEGDQRVSIESHTILKIISLKLEAQAFNSSSSEIRALAKEARLVLTARQSSKVIPSTTSGKAGTTLQKAFAKGNDTYQEALRLLQDPILPVRAHGLILLKDLAACGSTDTTKKRLMDPALTTAILDIYIQAIQDDESFLYLNAVKGIAEMANSGGQSMIKRLVELYLASGQTSISKSNVDMQLRMGEALLQVIQKLEEALSPHIDVIVEPLLTALRDTQRPTTLRSSLLSILGTCVEASPVSFSASRLGNRIVDAMLDLLSVETANKSPNLDTQRQDMEDATQLNPKLPQLRRAAILLLALFVRGTRHQLEAALEKKDDQGLQQQESLSALRLPNGSIVGGGGSSKQHTLENQDLLFSQDKAKRASIVLEYVAQTDSDGLVRHQSKELLEELRLLTLAMYTR